MPRGCCSLLRRIALLVFPLAAGCGSNDGPAPRATERAAPAVASQEPDVEPALMFAERFYDWYVRAGAPLEATTRDSGALFGAELLAALREDRAAQARRPGEGLTWDPFLGTQDPCPSHRLGSPSLEGGRVRIPVTGTCGGIRPRGRADVIAELERRDTTWVFVDFRHVGDSGSVLGDLAALKRARADTTGANSRPAFLVP